MTGSESRKRDQQLVRQLAGVKSALDRLTNVLTDQFHQTFIKRNIFENNDKGPIELVYFEKILSCGPC